MLLQPRFILNTSACAPDKNLRGLRAFLLVVRTSFAGTWYAHLHDGGDDGVVPIAFADQVDDPFGDLFYGAPVQAMVFC